MTLRREQLPIGCAHWPVVPNERVNAATYRDLACSDDRSRWCSQQHGGWICTRAREHPLPHVALSGHKVIAVWDQLWFVDVHSDTIASVSPAPRRAQRSSVTATDQIEIF